jgi:hypothetical protein
MNVPVAKIALRAVGAATPSLGRLAAARLAASAPLGPLQPSLGGDSFGSAPTRARSLQSFAHAHHLRAVTGSNVSAARHRAIMGIVANLAPR